MSTTGRDNIVAESTPSGKGGISVVRFSGDESLARVLSFVRVRGVERDSRIMARHAYLADVSSGGSPVDEGLLLYFEGPASFTGEDVVELHLHGNPTLVQLVLRESIGAGFRPATAGEFTQRAFLNGRLDLTQVDALGGMLAAERREMLEVATSQLGGSLRDRLLELREEVLSVVASLELGLDFVEEGYEFVDLEALARTLVAIGDLVTELRRTYRVQSEMQRLPTVALVGPPNAGKSTLFNAILGFDRSITHDAPGTTRDYVAEVVDLGNRRFRLVDTAGLRETEEVVEAAGIERVAELLREADIILSLVDGSAPDAVEVSSRQLASFASEGDVLPVFTHADISRPSGLKGLSANGTGREASVNAPVFVSSIDRSSVNSLVEALESLLGRRDHAAESVRYFVSDRQEEVLGRIDRILGASLLQKLSEQATGVSTGTRDRVPLSDNIDDVGFEIDTLLVAAELRRLLPLFGELVGEATNEDVLDRVFSQFCIGK